MKNDYASALTGIVTRARKNNPPAEGDIIIDGLRYCKVCKKPKETRINFHFGDGTKETVVPIICDCKKREMEVEKKAEEYRTELARIAKLKESSLMSSKLKDASFAAYTQRPENAKAYKIARNYCDKFYGTESEPGMYERNQGLLFYGPVGTGKSYTAACIANNLLNRGISVVMTSFVKILQAIQSGRMDESEYIHILNTARLLIIDDLGTERNTDYALEKVYNIIDSRVREDKPLILTTNLTLKELAEPPDIRYGRIYDRIFEVCYPVQVTGLSFRRVEALQRQSQMKAFVEEWK
jgi:DNA replication protein DnaC